MTLRDGRTWSLYSGLVQTSLDKSEHVWSAIFPHREPHAVQIWPTPKPVCSFLTAPRSKLYDPPKWWKQRFVTLQKVWTGVKCNFSWEYFQKRYSIRKLSLNWVRICHFTRIGPKTKKLWFSIIPAQRRSHQSHLGQTQKGVNRNFSWPQLDKSSVFGKLSILDAKICSFSMIGQKIKNTALLVFWLKT